ncbi:MAG: glycerol-3-phosphate acyltransferase [Chloroflexota bacterium]|nr:glycerol-3-phosphate acyltransferase [Chloroflexota bacterium]
MISIIWIASLLLGAYLLGSFPTAYIWVLFSKGNDITKSGSGNVGASNVDSTVGRKSAVAVGLFDFLFKGLIPAFFLGLLDLENWLSSIAALLLVVGHNWSIFLRFKGGRGVATSMGIIIGMSLWQEMLVLAIGPGLLGRGFINRDTGLWTFVSLILLVPLTIIFGRDIHIILFIVGISAVLLTKRITSNGNSINETGHTINVLLCRLIWDRDIRSRNLWVSRDFN